MIGVLALGLLAAGCGSSGEDEPEPIAKKTFVKKVNALCYDVSYRRLGPSLGEVAEKTVKSDEQEKKKIEAEYVSDSMVPIVQTEIDEIRDLGLPRGEEKKAEAYLDEVQEFVDKAEEEPEAYPSKLSLTPASYKADKLGIHECPIG